ncbi:MAG: Panacea domain-containing protein [Sinimarinibacterium flocculans]|uniref:Panacea domain-containing protein n=1 Tax=Sinimarinibacterium flocculans TaxID=985250 RepID=UPI003C440F1B
MIKFEFDAEKAIEALAYVASRLNKPGNMYSVLKALYIADKAHLERYGRFIYGETYAALPYGPVPQNAYDAMRVLSGERQQCFASAEIVADRFRRLGDTVSSRRDPDLDSLSRSDVECLDEAIRDIEFDSFDAVKTKTHDAAYNKTPRCQELNVEDIVNTFSESRRGPVLRYLTGRS